MPNHVFITVNTNCHNMFLERDVNYILSKQYCNPERDPNLGLKQHGLSN